MTAAPLAAVPAHADRGNDIRSNIARLEHLQTRGGADKDEVFGAMGALGDAELMQFGLNAYRMNLLSLFGETWSQEKIAKTAREAAIHKMWGGWEYHHHYLPRLTSAPDARQLANLPLNVVGNQLARGRGLVIVSFHLGHMRYIPSDLAHAGILTSVPLARDSFNDYATARGASPDAALWEYFKFVNVEDGGGALALARTLAKGGCVFSTIDGNTGLDGPRGDERRATVTILGSTGRVKDGLISMAARFGAPILPITACTVDGERVCQMAPIVDPGRPLSGEDAKSFVAAAVQDAYSFLGQGLLSSAGEWSGGDLFHQWRVPSPATSRPIEEVERTLMQDLEAGGRVTVNARRIVQLPSDLDIIWTDVMTGRCYKLPVEMTGLTDKLSADSGVNLDWLNRHTDGVRSRMWGLICQLASRDAIRSYR